MYRRGSLAIIVVALWVVPVRAAEVIFFDASNPAIKALAIDQPMLDVAVYDGGTVITDGGEPVIFHAYVDTGASGSVISHLTATGTGGVPSLGFTENDYLGEFDEVGVGGVETGYVTRAFELRMFNGLRDTGTASNLGEFHSYGPQQFWVRQAMGTGEYIDLLGYDPINIVGMPAIRQKVMCMDFRPLNVEDVWEIGYVETHLRSPGDPGIPATNATLYTALRDFSGGTVGSGTAPHPTYSENPVIQKISVSHDGLLGPATAPDQEWLFDTGAGGSFISFAVAQEIGLIDASYADVADYLPNHTGIVLPVGGIGPSKNVPLFQVDEVRIPTREGFDLVWKNVDLVVLDIEAPDGIPLDGVFGMNMMLPSVTIDVYSIDPGVEDPWELLAALLDMSPGYFDFAVFDATDPADPQLRLGSAYIPLWGDADGNGIVDMVDYQAWFNHYGSTGGLAQGDFDGDGLVDMTDYAIWYDHYGVGASPIPEPCTAALLALAAAGVLSRRRRGGEVRPARHPGRPTV